MFSYLKAPAGEESTSLASPEARDTKSAHVEDCPKCFSYKARLTNCLEELEEKSELIKSLKEDLSKLRGQLSTSEKVFVLNEGIPSFLFADKILVFLFLAIIVSHKWASYDTCEFASPLCFFSGI